MFKATCASCGNACEVPFKPNGSKPIYCRDCFKKEMPSNETRPFQPRSDDRGFDVQDRPKFQATCDTCGDNCEVPFRPDGSRPIYCRACFGKKNGESQPSFERKAAPSNFAPQGFDARAEFKSLNSKLDRILTALNANPAIKDNLREIAAVSPKPVKAEMAKPVAKVLPEVKAETKPEAKVEKKAKVEKALVKKVLASAKGGSASGGKKKK
jgi:CxxC-x17-CxxC domain-containing protein